MGKESGIEENIAHGTDELGWRLQGKNGDYRAALAGYNGEQSRRQFRGDMRTGSSLSLSKFSPVDFSQNK